MQFTDQHQDSEANGIVHFKARSYNEVLGQWMSPDPAGLAAVDPANPQTWNRYAYVANNPVSATDPTGLMMCEGFCDEDGSGGFEPWNGGPSDGGGGFGGSGGGGGGGGGAQLNACGVDPFCIQKGGIGPFGSPVANGGSWRDAQYLTGGNFLLHLPTPDGSLVLNCAGSMSAADCAWDPFSIRYVLNGDQPRSINPMYPGLTPGDVPAGGLAAGVLQGQRALWQQSSITANVAAWATLVMTAPVWAPPVLGATSTAVSSTVNVSRGGVAGLEAHGIPATTFGAWILQNWENAYSLGSWIYSQVVGH